MNKKSLLSVLIFLLALFAFVLFWQFVLPKSDAQLMKKDFLTKKVQKFSYVAVGDSLTEGVGDINNQGGFVNLVKQDLARTYSYQVRADNYGVSGNTSQQILQRMVEHKDLQTSLKQADLLSLTVGGNDLMRVVRKNLANLTVDDFVQAQATYQANLANIIEQARKDNPNLPIYILGLYNPFYLSFSDLPQMQEVLDGWNQSTQDLISQYERVYFVPVDELLSKGLDRENQAGTVNDLLFAEDNFHPNTTGYQLMAQALMEKINETKAEWINKK